MEHRVVTDYTNVNVNSTNVKVYVRLRPPFTGPSKSKSEEKETSLPQDMFILRDQKQLSLKNKDDLSHKFLFDRVFWTDTRQAMFFQEVAKPLVQSCLEGRNCCVFAYGQTGSGKTHTIFGNNGDQRGMIPRAVEFIFAELEKTTARYAQKEVAVTVSLLELYCDQIRDLGKVLLLFSSL